MGMGLQTSEEVVVDQDSGKLLRWGSALLSVTQELCPRCTFHIATS